MDMLFPEKEDTRPAAIQKTVRTVQWIQAVVVTCAALYLYGVSITPLLAGVVILIISEATIRLTVRKKNTNEKSRPVCNQLQVGRLFYEI